MVRRLSGGRKRSRHKMLKSPRAKGKVSLTKYFQKLKIGDKVRLKAEPSYHKGMYNLRFHKRVGVVSGKKGRCYEVTIKDGGKSKKLIVHPVHLVRC